MADFYKFLASYEALIYLVLAIGGLFSFRWLWRSWRDLNIAVFSLEREFSARSFSRAGILSGFIVLLFISEFFMTTFFLPGLPANVWVATPTLDFISTPTGTLSPAMMTQFSLQGQQPAAGTSGCLLGQIEITFPQPGDEIKGAIELSGTVDIPNFGFYKYEVASAGSDNWATISAGRVVVRDAPLGRWDSTALTPGDYQLRLVVTDNQGQTLPACVVPVRVIPLQ